MPSMPLNRLRERRLDEDGVVGEDRGEHLDAELLPSLAEGVG
jgi:hypothetical protein